MLHARWDKIESHILKSIWSTLKVILPLRPWSGSPYMVGWGLSPITRHNHTVHYPKFTHTKKKSQPWTTEGTNSPLFSQASSGFRKEGILSSRLSTEDTWLLKLQSTEALSIERTHTHGVLERQS